ncbi:MAG: GNAT family N-acetyltransferase [Chitinophagaceae bacterium]
MNKTTWNEYNIKRLSIEHLNDLAILYKEVYGRIPQLKYFQRKYDTAFTGILYTGYLAYDTQNRPAAFFGAIPCFIQYGGDKILAAQAVDAMTHPLHRSKGLFVALANLTVELCRIEGIRILFGFPNQHSLSGLVSKLQWNVAGYMAFFNLQVKTFPLEQFASKFRVLKGIYKWYMTHHLSRYKLPYKGLSQTSSGYTFASVYRDDDYLEYKSYNQTTVVKIEGVTVWLKVNNGLIVGDMTIPDDFENVIQHLKKLARKLGLRQVMFQVSEGMPLYSLLEKITKPERGFTVIVKDLGSGLPPGKLKFTFADIDIF